MMTAGLPMYDAPALRDANSRLWQEIARRLAAYDIKNLPASLQTPVDLPSFWSDPALVFGQTCGFPFVKGLCGQAQIIATPVYDVPEADGAFYGSALIVHRSSSIRTVAESRGRVAAINDRISNTGMNLFRVTLARAGARGTFFSNVIETGSHRESVTAVVTGEADIAAIDVISLSHFKASDPHLDEELHCLGFTPKTPGLPFITSGALGPDLINALREILIDVVKTHRDSPALAPLRLKDIHILPASAYQSLSDLEHEAIRLGYPVLA